LNAWEQKVLDQIELDEIVELLRQLQSYRSFSGEEKEVGGRRSSPTGRTPSGG